MIANISSQYLAEITPVLDGDYCSTWWRLLQYLGQVLAHIFLGEKRYCFL